jgi:glycosyltransferase involved in cell wall biosynthesis
VIRVLHVVNLPAPNPWLNGVADHHDRSRFEHVVVDIGARSELHASLEQHGIRSFALEAPRRRQTATAVLRLASLLRRERVDIVQTHTVNPTTVGLLAAKLARTPLTILTRHHADFTTIFHKPVHREIDRLHALSADRLWSPSEYIKQCMVRYERIAPERIAVVPHGFDFSIMKPRLEQERRRALRESLGGDDKILIATIARLSVEKGHEYLLRAIPAIVRAYPNARFLFAGSGPRKEELERMIAELGIGEYVRLLGWRKDPWDVIEAMDLIAHPSLSEPFGIVFVESMALEKAVVTTGESAAPEIIDHGETGMILPPRDPDAMARAILELLADPARRRRMGEEARRRADAKYNFPKMMREYERCYDEWLAAAR